MVRQLRHAVQAASSVRASVRASSETEDSLDAGMRARRDPQGRITHVNPAFAGRPAAARTSCFRRPEAADALLGHR